MVAPLLLAAAPFIKDLFANGLSLLGNAVLTKGKSAVEEKLGIKLPDGDKPLSPEQLENMRQLEFDHEETLLELSIRKQELDLKGEEISQTAVTKRWEADMLSDSYLSKNVRPIALLGTLVAVLVLALLSAGGVAVADAYVTLFGQVLQIMVGAYFIGRSTEKGIDVYQGWKHTKGE